MQNLIYPFYLFFFFWYFSFLLFSLFQLLSFLNYSIRKLESTRKYQRNRICEDRTTAVSRQKAYCYMHRLMSLLSMIYYAVFAEGSDSLSHMLLPCLGTRIVPYLLELGLHFPSLFSYFNLFSLNGQDFLNRDYLNRHLK